MNSNDINEQYLDKVYDDLQRLQQSLLTDIKTGASESKEKDLQKQFTLINTLMLNTLRLRNLKKKIKQSLDN
jgi:hypothetical protein